MSAPAPFLPYGRQLIEDDDVAAVVAALRSDWLTTGPAVTAFETAIAQRVGVAHALACANGTAALHLAALALELQPGDRVVVPTLTFLATANAARYVGAEVVFADVDPDSGLLTPEGFVAALERAGGAVKAVFPVHLNGQCVDMAAIAAIARPRGIRIVEDACHALGSLYAEGGPAVGSCAYADLACFSFHPVKTIAMGEGGLVTAADPVLAERVARLRSHGIVREAAGFQHADLAFAADGSANPWYYEMPEPGFNYRASDINCALGLSQLGKLDRFAAARTALVAHYDQAIAGLNWLRPVARRSECRTVWHLYAVLIDFDALGLPRAEAMNRLRALGIGTQVHYLPVHHQPYYRQRYGALALPGADAYYARQLSLPLFAGMTTVDVDRVVAALATLAEARG